MAIAVTDVWCWLVTEFLSTLPDSSSTKGFPRVMAPTAAGFQPIALENTIHRQTQYDDDESFIPQD